MRKKSITRRLFRKFEALYLTDKILLIFMIILMVQSMHNLFFHELVLKDTEALDVVIRTTASAIFGYFISAGFRSDIHDEANAEIKDTAKDFGEFPIENTEQDDLKPKETDFSRKTPIYRMHQQIVIVSAIGIFSLIILVIARNFGEMNTTSIATLSQLRDFVSGSVGFLIGHSIKDQK